MAAKHVLDVGNCAPDHTAIRTMIESKFDADVAQAHGGDDTLAALQNGEFDLVLINRKLDRDYSDGMEILKQIKNHPELKDTPVMLVTNYPEHQEKSVEAGGEYGFGKLELEESQTHERLGKFLA